MICPSCRSVNTMVGADGGGLCFDCRFEWDPAELVAGPAPVILPFAMATVDEVFGPPLGHHPDDFDPEADVRAVYEMIGEPYSDEPTPSAPAPSTIASPVPVIDEADDAAFEMDDLLGQVATLDGGQQALIVGTDGYGPLTVITASGDELIVPLSDVIRVDPLPDIPEPVTDVHEGDQPKEAT